MNDISRSKDELGLRWYTDGNGNRSLSVTTVLKFLEEDDTGLRIWQERNDGSGDNPDHEHLFWYSAPRGTICHYTALDPLTDEDLYGQHERGSMRKMIVGPEYGDFDEASEDIEDVVYSIMKYREDVDGREEYDPEETALIDVLYDDTKFFNETFREIRELLGITDDSVIEVERFLLNEEDGYGGQCDLLYRAPDGAIVLADLKTSGSLRQKHVLQGTAYAKAVEKDDDIDVDEVDRIEVIRIHPDTKTWEVHASSEPLHMLDEDWYTSDGWYSDKWGEYNYADREEMWETFKELVKTAHEWAEAKKFDVSVDFDTFDEY